MKRFWLLLGDFKQVVSQLGIYVSVYSILATSMLLWRIVIKPLMDEYQLNISIWWFVIAGVLAMILIGVMERIHGLPNYYESAYKLNPLYKDIQQLLADNRQLHEDINELKKQPHVD